MKIDRDRNEIMAETYDLREKNIVSNSDEA